MSDDRITVPGSTLTRSVSKTRGFNQRGRESGARALQESARAAERKNPRRPRPISPASPAQRAYVKATGFCMACGAEQSEYVRLTFAHFWARGRGGCDSPLCGGVLCVRPGGTGCHDRQERGELDLLAIIVDGPNWDAYRERFQHALEHARPVELIEKLAAARVEWLS
jgi:hypothetical protein